MNPELNLTKRRAWLRIFSVNSQKILSSPNFLEKFEKFLVNFFFAANWHDKNELKQLLTSNFYSLLYYNAEIWMIPSLHANLKKHLLSCFPQALKILGNNSDPRISFEKLHVMNGRATPNQMMLYKHSFFYIHSPNYYANPYF